MFNPAAERIFGYPGAKKSSAKKVNMLMTRPLHH